MCCTSCCLLFSQTIPASSTYLQSNALRTMWKMKDSVARAKGSHFHEGDYESPAIPMRPRPVFLCIGRLGVGRGWYGRRLSALSPPLSLHLRPLFFQSTYPLTIPDNVDTCGARWNTAPRISAQIGLWACMRKFPACNFVRRNTACYIDVLHRTVQKFLISVGNSCEIKIHFRNPSLSYKWFNLILRWFRLERNCVTFFEIKIKITKRDCYKMSDI